MITRQVAMKQSSLGNLQQTSVSVQATSVMCVYGLLPLRVGRTHMNTSLINFVNIFPCVLS